MIKIDRPNLADAPAWYPDFFELATGDDLMVALEKNKREMADLISSIPSSSVDYRYAENKWTVKQVFIHLADEERYFAYKAACYSRQANVRLEISEGEAYTKDLNAANRTLKDVGEELIANRNATICLFSSMTNDMLDFKDFPDQAVIYTARSLGWMAVGHSIHHCNFIKEKYLV